MTALPGDIAIYPQIHGEEIRIEHWNVAGNHGRAVGKTISGSPQVFVKIPVFWSSRECNICFIQANNLTWSNVVGQQLRYCGIGNQYDDVIIKGDPGEMKVGQLVEFIARKGDRKPYSS